MRGLAGAEQRTTNLGDPRKTPLAEAYAVHIMAAYDHYRYRAAQIDNKGLSRTDDWMAPKLADSAEELRVWGVRA